MFRSGGASTSCGGAKSNGGHRLTADELDVAEILLSLPRLIYSNARCIIYSNVRWGSKKKRSVNKRKVRSHPSWPKRKAKSPTTPLDFSGEDMSKRKMREELRREIVRLEKKQKLERVEADQNQLLRAKRLKLLQLDFDIVLPELELPEEFNPKPSTTGDGQKKIQGFIHEEEPAAGLGSSTSVTSSCSTSQVGPFRSSGVGSHSIPDLNLPAHEEPSQPLLCLFETRLYRAQLAAVARRRRMLIVKEKKKRIHHYLPYNLHHRPQQQILT